ncbi:hypothetical protein FE257_010367 [Aspergillus nanangensis]|uniref:Carrier domain-containing protein n=1 Tax=Aspergillus nanangensis TaxID=2582783 RepID=A0AAD4CIK5_ASPNN|nr:hypothetical protein FE257_010367 [Aspergillus nanangensis]
MNNISSPKPSPEMGEGVIYNPFSSEYTGEIFPTVPQGASPDLGTDLQETEFSYDCGRHQPQSVTRTQLLLGWGAVLALYTRANDVLYGLVRRDGGTGPGVVWPFRLVIQPTQSVASAQRMVEGNDAAISHLAHYSPSQVKSMNPDSWRAWRYNNVLAVWCGNDQNARAEAQQQHEYPLWVDCVLSDDDKDAIHLRARFNTAVISQKEVWMILSQLAHFQTGASEHQSAPVRRLQGISQEGLSQVLKWNGETALIDRQVCVHTLIEKQAEGRPMAPAIYAWDGALNFRELNWRASCLATKIRDRGLNPGTLICLAFEKSMWAAVAMLGVLKAGMAFMMLDVSQPIERLRKICTKARGEMIISSRKNAEMTATLSLPQLIYPGAEDKTEMPPVGTIFGSPSTTRPHDVASVVFTSGSSGEPKLIAIDHSAITSGIQTFGQAVNMNQQTRVFQTVSYAFTPCIVEHLVTLVLGACLCVPSQDKLENSLETAISELDANWMWMTPSISRVINPERVPGIQTLVFTGERIARSDLQAWDNHGDIRATYGLSEYAIGVTRALKGDLKRDARSIGRPFACVAWIVDPDDHNRLMPIGAEGELIIQGPCLSRDLHGYDAIESRLIQNPQWARHIHPHGRGPYLKTGDLVRYEPSDGNFLITGRKDTQLKIRGQRVEVLDVQHELRKYFPENDVSVDVVNPAGDTTEQNAAMLVAFVADKGRKMHCTDDNEATSTRSPWIPPTDEFRKQAQAVIMRLSQVLPGYMVPTSFLRMNSLPWTPSGKLHRRSLREQGSKLSRRAIMAYITAERPYRAPSSSTEKLLQRLCAQVLGIGYNQVGMEDNFFDLGGDSLSARQLVVQGRTGGLILTVALVFEQPTLGALATSVRRDDRDQTVETDQDAFGLLTETFLKDPPSGLPEEYEIESVVPALEVQGSFANQQGIEYFLYRVTGPLDESKIQVAVEALVKGHSILRTGFVIYQGHLVQVVYRQMSSPPYIVIDKEPGNSDADIAARAFCMEDMARPFPVSKPVTSFTLVKGGVDDQVLVVRLSHAQFDGPSMQRLLHDLWTAYDSHSLQVDMNFTEIVRHCARRRTPGAVSFWKSLLAGSSPTILPLSAPGAVGPETGSSICVTRDMPPMAPPRGITMAVAAKAAWSCVLHETCGADDLVFGQMVNHRGLDIPGIDKVVGPNINITPVRVRYPTGRTAMDLLRDIQTQHVQSMDFQTLDPQDIVQNATQWPVDSYIQSVVLHQGWDDTFELTLGKLAVRSMGLVSELTPGRLIYVMTVPSSNGTKAMLWIDPSIVSAKDAEHLVDLFRDTLMRIMVSPDLTL